MEDREHGQGLNVSRVAAIGEWVGPYHLLEVLGRGGMGTVFLAEQAEPVRRRVALKILNREKDTDRGVARFEAERQALALMNHPSIATVYDSGTTPSGLPFFAMELIDGSPILDYCDQNRLSIEDRLDLFCQICGAVQHAHQRMVIHRDLKPSNVLIAVEEGRPVPKIIDFGIAKGTDEPLVERDALKTRGGLPIGTPMFMSPEQIEGDSLDARVDVYALGVLLYQLLSGVLPFDPEKAEAFQLMMRILREDPPRPSARFGSLEEPERRRIAAQRGSDAGALRRQLVGDLDWIVMKAMEKRRERRYGTAAELRADVKRFLDHRPTVAAPPTVAYRLGKVVRRHRAWVLAGVLATVALIAATAVSTVAMVRARRARDEARVAEHKASQTVEYLRKVLGSVDPGVDGRQVRVVDLLSKASEMVAADLADQPQVEAAVRKTIGLTLLELGVFEDALPELERAVAIQRSTLGPDHPETLHSIDAVARLDYKLGRYQEAATIHRQVFDRQKELLGPEDPTTLWTMYHLAKALDKQGAWDEAESLYRDNMAIRRRVLGSDHLDTLVTINSLSLFLSTTGRRQEAEEMQRRNLEDLTRLVGPHHPDTLRAKGNLVEILNHQGRHAEAEELGRKSLRSQHLVLGPEHSESLSTSAQIAVAMHHEGRYLDAEAVNRRVLAIRSERLGPLHPDTIATRVNLGLDVLRQGRGEEAEELLATAAADAEQALPEGHWRLARCRAAYGRCLLELGRIEDARHWLRLSLDGIHPDERDGVEGLLATLAAGGG